MTGNCGKRSLTSESNCGPSMPGIRQSLMTRSISSCSSTSRASRPLPAVKTRISFWLNAELSRSQSLGSSSTTRTLCVIVFFLILMVQVAAMGRNVQVEGRAGIFFADALDTPVMVFHDRIDLRQAQAGARGLGGDERRENTLDHVRLDALAGVGHADDGIARVLGNADGQAPALGHGVDGIEDQVQAGLFQLPGVGIQGGAGCQIVDLCVDIVDRQFRGAETEDFPGPRIGALGLAKSRNSVI